MSTEKMNCKKICELLTAYLDGEVTPSEQGIIESHLEVCQHCRHEMELFKAAQTGLRDIFMRTAGDAQPAPQVWSRIRARIEEDESRREGLPRWFNRNLIWQVATAAAGIVIILFAASIWQFGGMNSAPQKSTDMVAPAPAPAPCAPEVMPSFGATGGEIAVSASVRTNAFSNTIGDTIQIETSFNNTSANVVTLAPYPPAIQVLDPFDYHTVRSFSAGDSDFVLQPGQSTTQSYEWDQRDNQGRQVQDGYYYIQPDITIDDQNFIAYEQNVPLEVLIVPEGGVKQQTIELAQAQALNGTTVTLEKIEMTATNTRFFASTSLSFHKTAPTEENGDIPLRAVDTAGMAKAQYRIDDGPVRDIGCAQFRSSDDSLELSWTQPFIGPIPQSAEKLVFTITAINGQEGKWEFTIPLK